MKGTNTAQNQDIEQIKLEAKTRQQLGQEYGIHYNTVPEWFKRIGIMLPSRKRIDPKHLRLFYEHYGAPVNYKFE
jgi:hypothetical protein